MDGDAPQRRRARRARARSRRAVRRAGDEVPRHARPRWGAAGARTEPRGGLERGARGEGVAGVARVATGAGVGDRRIGGRIRMRRKRFAALAALGVLVARSRGRSRLRRRRRRRVEREYRDRRSRHVARRDPGEREERRPGQPRHLGGLCGQVVGRPVHAGDGCKVQTKDGASSDDMVDLISTGAVGRRFGIGRRNTPTHREGRRRARELRPHPELRGRVRGPQGPVVQHGRRGRVRRPARPRAERDGLPEQHPSRRTTDSWAAIWPGTDYKGKLSIYDNQIFIADAASVPQGDAAGPQHHESLRARRRPVQRCGRPA